jgi:translation initiation factor IF-3
LGNGTASTIIPSDPPARLRQVNVRLHVGPVEFDRTVAKVAKLLAAGCSVRVAVTLRGRVVERPRYGQDVLKNLMRRMGPSATASAEPSFDGRRVTALLEASAPGRGRDHWP